MFYTFRLNRFRPGGDRRSHQLIDIPTELCLNEFQRKKDILNLEDNKEPSREAKHNHELQTFIESKREANKLLNYELASVICHRGSHISRGKFIAYVKRDVSGTLSDLNEKNFIAAKTKQGDIKKTITEPTVSKWFEF